MAATWIAGVAAVAALAAVAAFLNDAGELRTLAPVGQENCRWRTADGVVGVEDIAIDSVTGMAILSANDRRSRPHGAAWRNGSMFAYDAKDPASAAIVPMTLEGYKDVFRPHGVALWRAGVDESEPLRLFVVNHLDMVHSRIEIFRVDWKRHALVYLEGVVHPLIHHPNDVVATGPTSFYVSNDHGPSSSELAQLVDDVLRRRRSDVVFYDGTSARVVAPGLLYANGVAVSTNGRRGLGADQFYVSETVGRAVRVYGINVATGGLTFYHSIDAGTGVDNIDVDPDTGDLYIGSHYRMLTFLVAHAIMGRPASPSQVIRIQHPDAESGATVSTVFLSEGLGHENGAHPAVTDDIAASSVGSFYKNTLLIGGVMDDGILVCSPVLVAG